MTSAWGTQKSVLTFSLTSKHTSSFSVGCNPFGDLCKEVKPSRSQGSNAIQLVMSQIMGHSLTKMVELPRCINDLNNWGEFKVVLTHLILSISTLIYF